jgi:prepilin-type processing-associated H-X9-DG protein
LEGSVQVKIVGLSLCFAAVAVAVAGCNLRRQATAEEQLSTCAQNMKKIAFGVLRCTGDNRDKCNLDANRWRPAVAQYISGANVFRCPADGSQGESYSFNSELFGATTSAMGNGWNTVMVYEGKDQKLDFRHDGKAVVVFADGHVRAIEKPWDQKLKWKL